MWGATPRTKSSTVSGQAGRSYNAAEPADNATRCRACRARTARRDRAGGDLSPIQAVAAAAGWIILRLGVATGLAVAASAGIASEHAAATLHHSGYPRGRLVSRRGRQVLLWADQALGLVREEIADADLARGVLLIQRTVEPAVAVAAELAGGGALVLDEVCRVLHLLCAARSERRRRVAGDGRSRSRPFHIAEDRAGARPLGVLQAPRGRNAADRAAEGRRVDVGVVLVHPLMAVDSTPLRALALAPARLVQEGIHTQDAHRVLERQVHPERSP
jgi:hypothetical protein